ncbi:MAG TPA: DJ-1/PfpI family protein [Desulfobacteria bacterium]|nr:DJ-1/PfpI family protein [Desulfobacteria bacterium]
MERKRIAIVLFENVEVLDFCGPFEVFSITRMDEEKRFEEPSPFEVKLVAEHEGAIVTTGGMRVIPDHTFESCPQLDILVVPGGWGTFKERENPAASLRVLIWP